MKKLKQFVVRKVAGNTIMVPVGETTREFNGLITLNSVAAFIWNHIEEVDTVEEMIEKIMNQYEVDHELAEKDANQFISDLKANGFIE